MPLQFVLQETVAPPSENKKRRKVYTSNEVENQDAFSNSWRVSSANELMVTEPNFAFPPPSQPAADVVAKKSKPAQPKKKPITSVYVTGLPRDATVEEMEEVFTKCGVIMEDISTGKPKIKLYQDNEGNFKGDALVSYFKEESVALAVNLLDESEFRVGDKSTVMRVQEAVFKEKEPSASSSNPAEKKGGNLHDKKRVQKKLHQLQRKLDWVDDEKGAKADKFSKIVILKHMFTHEELEEDPALILELKDEVREECEKLGEVTNVILYDKSPEGVISVRFKENEGAVACIARMNGRFFGGRQVTAEVFDGKTKYEKSSMKDSEETEEETQARLEKYAKWLESEEAKAGTVGGSGVADMKVDEV
ncbi:hypothetical protein BC936DRAFT_146964 [Jimgerdemannia flammicorona]|uniref:RRM domain-containing protein n=1 Tax=Jimgerdemannia flammicorona TaxID=994334 RepID=A0A433D6F7_9FUNG|nr:hypothetical protein BC936DRAFT_146964 [Jimgerdemannia flammicorona]